MRRRRYRERAAKSDISAAKVIKHLPAASQDVIGPQGKPSQAKPSQAKPSHRGGPNTHHRVESVDISGPKGPTDLNRLSKIVGIDPCELLWLILIKVGATQRAKIAAIINSFGLAITSSTFQCPHTTPYVQPACKLNMQMYPCFEVVPAS